MAAVDVMSGKLSDFELAEVLQVVGIGRQYTGVELSRDNGVLGTIFVKGGKIVSVDTPDAAGRDALFRLFNEQQGHFRVYRADAPDALPEPLGSLGSLLMEAIARATSYQRHATPSELRPSVAVAQSTTSPPSEAGANLIQGEAAQKCGTILGVVSPKGGSGKTTLSLNLALSLVRQGRRVVLVDADVNGDVLSAINARGRGEYGAYDVLMGAASLEQATLSTVFPDFKILPALGAKLPSAAWLGGDHAGAWRKLLNDLGSQTDIVVVDTPAGMFGTTAAILAASTHVLGVLQAEVIAARSFERFRQAIDGVPGIVRPKVIGVVLNMLQTRHGASLEVFQNACATLPSDWLFDTTIPRHPAFLDAAQEGLPLRQMDELAPPAVAWLFDNLAAEVAQRLALPKRERRSQALLV
jgi:chromosome partitioning protein